MIKEEKLHELKEETEKRVAKLKDEMKAKKDFKLTVFENPENYDQMIIMDKIEAVAKCEHHRCEFRCVITAGYLPNPNRLMGASKFIRIVEKYLNLDIETLQERATQQIMSEFNTFGCRGAMVVIKGQHSCIAYRGVHSTSSVMITSAVSGVFQSDSLARGEFLSLIK